MEFVGTADATDAVTDGGVAGAVGFGMGVVVLDAQPVKTMRATPMTIAVLTAATMRGSHLLGLTILAHLVDTIYERLNQWLILTSVFRLCPIIAWLINPRGWLRRFVQPFCSGRVEGIEIPGHPSLVSDALTDCFTG